MKNVFIRSFILSMAVVSSWRPQAQSSIYSLLIYYIIMSRHREGGRVTVLFTNEYLIQSHGFAFVLKQHGKWMGFFGFEELPFARKSWITGWIDSKKFTVGVISCCIHRRWQRWLFTVCVRVLSQRRVGLYLRWPTCFTRRCTTGCWKQCKGCSIENHSIFTNAH